MIYIGVTVRYIMKDEEACGSEPFEVLRHSTLAVTPQAQLMQVPPNTHDPVGGINAN